MPTDRDTAERIAAGDREIAGWIARESRGWPTTHTADAIERALQAARADERAKAPDREKVLRLIISDCAKAAGSAVSVECSTEFMAMMPQEITLDGYHIAAAIRALPASQERESEKPPGFYVHVVETCPRWKAQRCTRCGCVVSQASELPADDTRHPLRGVVIECRGTTGATRWVRGDEVDPRQTLQLCSGIVPVSDRRR